MGELFSLPHLIFLAFALPFAAIAVVPFWFIAKRAGLNPALSLLIFVPLVGIVVLYYIAFTEWPSLSAQWQQPTWQSAPPPPAL
jgi:hypothetical protein